jgi:hypothetical protein
VTPTTQFNLGNGGSGGQSQGAAGNTGAVNETDGC